MIERLKRWCSFSGRLSRRNFLLWVLCFWAILFGMMLIDAVLHLGGSWTSYSSGGQAGFTISGGLLSWIFAIAMLVPNAAVAVRRLHDGGRSGWWLAAPLPFCGLAWALAAQSTIGGVAAFAAFVLGIVVLVFLLRRGTDGTNAYGGDSSGADIAEAFG